MSEYQVVALEDVDDWLGDYPGEMRGITYAIGAEQVAITYRRMPQHTGSKGSYGLLPSAEVQRGYRCPIGAVGRISSQATRTQGRPD